MSNDQGKKKESSLVAGINEEINRELSDESVSRALLATTFKGLTAISMKKAVMEGMIRGFTFKDFLEKNVYAIPFGQEYSLITSIDFARKRGMKSGIVGKDAPVFQEEAGKIVSCSVTVKRKVGNHIGDFTSLVFFDEYNNPGKGIWKQKPRTMISKVAEMHALRMACPEELSQSYIEEEFDAAKPDSEIQDRLEKAKVESEDLSMGKILKDGKTKNKKDKESEEDKDKANAAEGVEGEGEGIEY